MMSHLAALVATRGEPVEPLLHPPWVVQTYWVTVRLLRAYSRSLTTFGLRFGMSVGLGICAGWIYSGLGAGWDDVQGRAAVLFFIAAFLTFMSISAFPAFVDEFKIFLRERLNGSYGVVTFTVANTLASLPFNFINALASATCVYWIAGLREDAGAFFKFVMTMFASLAVVESLMMAIATVVPHFLAGESAARRPTPCTSRPCAPRSVHGTPPPPALPLQASPWARACSACSCSCAGSSGSPSRCPTCCGAIPCTTCPTTRTPSAPS